MSSVNGRAHPRPGDPMPPGVPYRPPPRPPRADAVCGWCFQPLADCIKHKKGSCGFAIDSSEDTPIQ
jgi:hypothetical protein